MVNCAANFWNPKIRGPVCFNPPAARSILPMTYKRTEMVLAGQSKAQIIDGIKTFIKQELPPLEPGAMSYMMSKEQYLTDDGHHNWMAHLMFYTPLMDGCRLGCRSAQLSRHAESTVQWRSGTNRRIHGSRGLVVGWNGGPSQGQVGTHRNGPMGCAGLQAILRHWNWVNRALGYCSRKRSFIKRCNRGL